MRSALIAEDIGATAWRSTLSHGYLFDEFLRAARTSAKIAMAVLMEERVFSLLNGQAVREAVDLTLGFRSASQWKDRYNARSAETPDELATMLTAFRRPARSVPCFQSAFDSQSGWTGPEPGRLGTQGH